MRLSSLSKSCLQALLFTLISLSPLSNATIITLSPDIASAGTGDTLSFDLLVSDLGDFGPDSLGAFDISVGFDSSVLAFDSYSLGGFLGDVLSGEAVDTSTGGVVGEVNVAEVSFLTTLALDALQPSEFLLATLNFDVLNLSLGAVTELVVNSSAVLADAQGFQLQVSSIGGAIVTGRDSTVPVPGTLLLLIAGLLGWRASIKNKTARFI